MDKSIKITLIIAATVLILGFMGFASFKSLVDTANPSNTVTASGTSTIKVVPDIITVSYSVQTKASNAELAESNNSEIVDKLITNLVVAGFDRDDIKTESFNVYPEYDWYQNSQRMKGYVAIHQLKLTILTNDSGMTGKAIDAGIDSGALINYINFELSSDLENGYKTQALEKATLDARTKAEAIARGLDKKVSGVLSITTSDFDYYPWVAYRGDSEVLPAAENAALAKQAASSINPSEREVTARVTVTFKLK